MTFRLAFIFCAVAAAFARDLAAEPLRYEPAVVQLTGILNTEDFFGPPNYGENPAEDSVERAYVLRLNQPIAVVGDPNDDLNSESLADIRRVHLASQIRLSQFVGGYITVEGSLYRAHTGHHVTDVLLFVRDAWPAEP